MLCLICSCELPIWAECLAHCLVCFYIRPANQINAVRNRREDAVNNWLAGVIFQSFERFAYRFRLAGRLMIRVLPRMTATCRERIAVGTNRRLI